MLSSDKPPRALFHPTDTVLTAIILMVLGYLYYETTNFEEVSAIFSQSVPPTMFPRTLIVIIGLLTLSLPFEHIMLAKKGKDIDKGRRDKIPGITWLTMMLLFAILLLFPITGMLLTMFLVCLLLPRLWGEKRLIYILLFAIFFPLSITLIFSGILSVHFETGLIGFTF